MEVSIFSLNVQPVCPLLLCLFTLIGSVNGVPYYDNMTKLFDDKLGENSNYNTLIRPVKDLAHVTKVQVTFDVIAIVEIDAVQQRFITNGFMGLTWMDEMIPWNPDDYGNATTMYVRPKDIWRPRIVVTNTLASRDLFKDDICPTMVGHLGNASWFPGSLFPASCKLDLVKFPFDEQHCYIEFYAMGYPITQVVFTTTTDKVGMEYFIESGEWVIDSADVELFQTHISSFRVKFHLKRLPGFFIVNILIPVVMMSFLNILVFVIPVDSGEKISYGITVLLALTVFMSIVSEQLPRSSDTLPLVTIYLLVLTLLSVFTVIVSVLIVRLHQCDQKETKNLKSKANYQSAFQKFKLAKKTASSFNKVQVKPKVSVDNANNNSKTIKISPKEAAGQPLQETAELPFNEKTGGIFSMLCSDFKPQLARAQKPNQRTDHDDENSTHEGNKWRMIVNHADFVSLVSFTVIWLTVTIAFLVEMTR